MSKRRREDDDDSELHARKLPKIRNFTSDLDIFPTELKIRMFEGLSEGDLFNMVWEDPKLDGVAKYMYSRKTPRAVILYLSSDEEHTTDNGTSTIDVRSPQKCRRYIELFGEWILDLNIAYGQNMSIADCVDFNQLLASRCAPTLRKITIRQIPNNANNTPLFNDAIPFSQVAYLEIGQTNLFGQLPLISACFPSVDFLVMIDSTINFPGQFSRLTRLTIVRWTNENTLDQYEYLFGLNQSLRHVTIITSFPQTVTMERLLNLIRHNQAIVEMTVRASTNIPIFVPLEEVFRFTREHQQLKTLYLPNHTFRTAGVMSLIGNDTAIEAFKCHVTQHTKRTIRREIVGTGFEDISIVDEPNIELLLI